MPPILLCWPLMLEADACDLTVEVEPSYNSFKFACHVTATEEQCGKITSDMEVHTKYRCVTEFLHTKKKCIQ
jgi:hypothetical protein